jgi:anti-sigma factor RsiW
MTDCQNADIRDQLPDLLHDRLSAGERAAVLAHVDGCAECRDELELLRGARVALVMHTPRIDTARIVSALPKPGTGVVIPLHAKRSRSRWADWRVAAAITVLAAGGSSVALLSRARATVPPVAVAPDRATDTAQSPIPAPPSSNAVAPGSVSRQAAERVAQAETASVGDQPEIGMEGRLNGLSERQLRSLLDDIGQMKAVPITEPEPAVINVNARSSSSDDRGADWL